MNNQQESCFDGQPRVCEKVYELMTAAQKVEHEKRVRADLIARGLIVPLP